MSKAALKASVVAAFLGVSLIWTGLWMANTAAQNRTTILYCAEPYVMGGSTWVWCAGDREGGEGERDMYINPQHGIGRYQPSIWLPGLIFDHRTSVWHPFSSVEEIRTYTITYVNGERLSKALGYPVAPLYAQIHDKPNLSTLSSDTRTKVDDLQLQEILSRLLPTPILPIAPTE